MSRRLPAHPTSLLFAPMIYIAWADGGLEPDELVTIANALRAHPDIGDEVKGELTSWLAPEDPPTAGELAALLERIRSSSSHLEQGGRHSLRELGSELAARAGHTVTEPEIQALTSLEDAVGLSGDERTASILWPLRPTAAVDSEGSPELTMALANALGDDYNTLRAEVLELLGGLKPEADPSRAAYRDMVHRWLGIVAERGWGMLAYPEAVGGKADVRAFLAVFETLGYGDLSLLVKFGVQFGLYGLGTAMLGSPAQHQRYLADAGRLVTPGCFAMTETGHGSNVGELETTATYDPTSGELVINTPNPRARKDYIGNAANYAQQAVVFAQLVIGETQHGVHALMVGLRDSEGRIAPGILIEECGAKLGLDGVDNGRISFNGIRVAKDALLSRFAQIDDAGNYHSDIASPGRRFFTMLGTLVGGRIAVASAAVSASKLALTIAVRYAARRRQFGPPGKSELRLLEYPHHRRRLLIPLARTIGFHAATRELGTRFATDGGDQKLDTDVAAIKALATWHAAHSIGECREACGGRGYLAESRFAQLKADTDVFTTFEGDNTVLLQLVAKGLLSDYARGMRGLGALGLARYIGKRAALVFDRNPYIVRRTDAEHLREASTQRGLLEARVDDLLHSLARRLKRRIDGGQDSFTALVECQSHALGLARAYGERLVFDALCRLETGAVPAGLEIQRSLAALAMIESDASWYLENGYIEATKAAAIRDEVAVLCAEAAQVATDVVSAFGLPDEVIRAPIGLAK